MKYSLLACAFLTIAPIMAQTVKDIKAEARNGQVFITWSEENLPDNALFSVYQASAPITNANIDKARLLADTIHKGSARDWWKDQHSFFPKKESVDPNVGFVIKDNAQPLDPKTGLHVHTVNKQTAGKSFFAVLWTSAAQAQSPIIVPGANATTKAVDAVIAAPNPIWILNSPPLKQGIAAGKPLVLSLHGRGGGAGDSAANYMWFSDSTQAWREGIPYQFKIQVSQNQVVMTLQDRTWVNREVTESPDGRDFCKAVSSWWLGYNVNITKTNKTNPIVVDNYTEKWILALIDWSNRFLGTDPNRTYLTGGSMGGSGSVAIGLHFPERFAAIHALVPVYSYTWLNCKTSNSLTANRLVCACGPLKTAPSKLTDGRDLFQYMDGGRNILAAKGDTPPIFATNGRSDASIPWVNNPPFYSKANESRQAFAVFWNNGNHGMSSTVPADVKAWDRFKFKYALNKSYPAFSNCSDNKNYGKGDTEDGDIIGWINRGLDWKNVTDTKNKYAITITAAHPEIAYPVTVDVTIRRRQAFLPKPGDKLTLTVNGTTSTYTMPKDGILTIYKVIIPSADGTSIQLTK